MQTLSKASFSCSNVCATAPKKLAFISKIVNKTFLLIADNLDNLSIENGRYDISANLVIGR